MVQSLEPVDMDSGPRAKRATGMTLTLNAPTRS
jgi:hypothetical protein